MHEFVMLKLCVAHVADIYTSDVKRRKGKDVNNVGSKLGQKNLLKGCKSHVLC